MRFGGALGLTSRGSRADASLGDSSASTATWSMNGAEITGARSKVPATSVEMTRPSEVDRTMLGRIGHGFRSLWATRYTEGNQSGDVMIKTTLRELIVYGVFVVLLCIMTFAMSSTNMYYFTNLMNNIFVQNTPTPTDAPAFVNVASMEDLWAFMLKGALLTYLYPLQWYNNQNYTNSDLSYVLHENRLLGSARLRQLRVTNNSCVVPGDFQEYIQSCYDEYNSGVEDMHPFGLKNGSAWTYQKDSKFSIGSGFSGQVSSYGNGGYMQVLPANYNDVLAMIQDLKDNLWIDRGTRAVFIDFTVYNANINLFCVVRLVAELPATGGVIPTYSLSTVKLIRYVTGTDYFVMACEIFIVLFIVYYTIEEVLEIKRHRLKYLKSFWNILDIIMLVLAFCCMVFDIYRTVSVGNMLDSMLKDPEGYPDFTFLSYWQITFNSALAVLVFCAWVKVFKYISFNKTMTQLSSTLSKCAKDLGGFAVMFFIFFLAFAQLGYLLFGSQVLAYSSIEQAIFSLFRTILGDFDFVALQQANRILGPAFFILYVFFVFFILLNMFLAIINDTYAEVKSDMADRKSEFEMGEYFKKGAFKMLEKMNIKKEKIADLHSAMAVGDMNSDGILDFEEWRQQMKQRGYADAEIEAVFAKYDVNGDRGLDADEQKKMKDDLDKQEMKMDDEYHQQTTSVQGASGGVGSSSSTVAGLRKRLNDVELSVENVATKVSSVLSKLESNERSQAKRRDVLTRLLDPVLQSGAIVDDQSRQELVRLIRDELINDGDFN